MGVTAKDADGQEKEDSTSPQSYWAYTCYYTFKSCSYVKSTFMAIFYLYHGIASQQYLVVKMTDKGFPWDFSTKLMT